MKFEWDDNKNRANISARKANKDVMNKENFSPDLSLGEREKRLLEMSDKEIDYSDISPLDEDFFNHAQLVNRQPKTEPINLIIDTEVLEWFRSQNKEYQTLINDVLRTYVTHQKGELKK
ncbi:MAG: BrnA antitoxin family protein [Microcystaceae cyanobacterium]